MRRRRTWGYILIFIGLLPVLAFGAGRATGGVAVFLLGAAMLLLGGPIIPIVLTVLPILWARRLSRRWKIVAAIPLLSLVIVALGYVAPALGLLPTLAFANLGPPFIAGIWGVLNLIYVGILALRLPRAPRAESPVAPG